MEFDWRTRNTVDAVGLDLRFYGYRVRVVPADEELFVFVVDKPFRVPLSGPLQEKEPVLYGPNFFQVRDLVLLVFTAGGGICTLSPPVTGAKMLYYHQTDDKVRAVAFGGGTMHVWAGSNYSAYATGPAFAHGPAFTLGEAETPHVVTSKGGSFARMNLFTGFSVPGQIPRGAQNVYFEGTLVSYVLSGKFYVGNQELEVGTCVQSIMFVHLFERNETTSLVAGPGKDGLIASFVVPYPAAEVYLYQEDGNICVCHKGDPGVRLVWNSKHWAQIFAANPFKVLNVTTLDRYVDYLRGQTMPGAEPTSLRVPASGLAPIERAPTMHLSAAIAAAASGLGNVEL